MRNLGTRKTPAFNMVGEVTAMAEAISSELIKCVKDVILLIEQSRFCEGDLIQFRLDWLYSVVVR